MPNENSLSGTYKNKWSSNKKRLTLVSIYVILSLIWPAKCRNSIWNRTRES